MKETDDLSQHLDRVRKVYKNKDDLESVEILTEIEKMSPEQRGEKFRQLLGLRNQASGTLRGRDGQYLQLLNAFRWQYPDLIKYDPAPDVDWLNNLVDKRQSRIR